MTLRRPVVVSAPSTWISRRQSSEDGWRATLRQSLTAITRWALSYPVSLDAFDGPLDLLLQLIERHELDISEVSLCAVTDQYLSTLEQFVDVEPAALADFLAIATRLLYIKSSSLLPRPADEEDEEEDAGDALVRQLIEYRRFRQAADELRDRSESGQRVHVRPVVNEAPDRRRTAPPDLSDVDAEDLQAVLASVLKRMPVEAPRAACCALSGYAIGTDRTCAGFCAQCAEFDRAIGPVKGIVFRRTGFGLHAHRSDRDVLGDT